jgi:hypothetical protein
MLFSLNSNMTSKTNASRSLCPDDASSPTFTGQVPDRPVVYLGEKRSQKPEPVKFTDEGE